eukprot:g62787.t1
MVKFLTGSSEDKALTLWLQKKSRTGVKSRKPHSKSREDPQNVVNLDFNSEPRNNISTDVFNSVKRDKIAFNAILISESKFSLQSGFYLGFRVFTAIGILSRNPSFHCNQDFISEIKYLSRS